jgi:hypothetical protein
MFDYDGGTNFALSNDLLDKCNNTNITGNILVIVSIIILLYNVIVQIHVILTTTFHVYLSEV